MPARSLRSSVRRWPDRETVDRAIRDWAAAVTRRRQDVLAIAYLGSYARGDLGGRQPFHRRALEFDTRTLPVPADVLVYSAAEWRTMARDGRRLWRVAE